jgi:glycosyltransferase involved in cell wall biosynthesis
MKGTNPRFEEDNGMSTSRAHDEHDPLSKPDRHGPVDDGANTGAPLKVCIVSNGLIGPVRNGGIATLYMGLAEALLEAGHHVTYLYTGGSYTEALPVEHWVAHYAGRGLEVVPLPEPEIPVLASPEVRVAYLTYEWLRARDEFDIIHFHEWRGNGYYSLLAKHQGLALEGTTLCVSTHSPTGWNKQGNGELMDQVTDIEADYLERRSVALADVLISSSRYMLDWLAEQGWSLPQCRRVIPNLVPRSALTTASCGPDDGPDGPRPRNVEEIVFFGRLEGRKGLALFCDALDRLADTDALPFRVTFLGKNGTIAGESGLEYLERRSSGWTFTWQALTTLDRIEAVDYLRQPGRLAVLPSLMDNSPLAVHECLLAGIPFLASEVGGIPEMVRPEDRPHALFPVRSDVLASRLETALRAGHSTARAAFDESVSRASWLVWHRDAAQADRPAETRAHAEPPRVSVCLAHFNRPHYLRQALDSLRAQDYPHFEVIVVDDGSTLPEAIAYLDAIEPELAARGWRIIRQENRSQGAARNHAARRARGEYLLFMDDDNIAKPHEISRFVRAALTSRADILTCCADLIRGADLLQPGQPPHGRWLYLGDSLAVSVFYNGFGDTNALVRRSTFLALGGFAVDRGCAQEDKEFYTRAILQDYRLEVVPEALYWYREHPSGLNLSTSHQANVMQALRPYRQALPDSLYQVLVYAYSHHKKSCIPPPPPPPPPPSPPPPLRHRVVDRIDLAVRRLGPVHRVARSALILMVSGFRLASRLLAGNSAHVPGPPRYESEQPHTRDPIAGQVQGRSGSVASRRTRVGTDARRDSAAV